MARTYKDGTTGIGPVADGDTYARRLNRSRLFDNLKRGAEAGASYTSAFNKDSSGSGSDKKSTITQKVDNFTAEVAPGLSIYKEASYAPMVIPGQEGQKGLFSLGGAIKGGIGGFIKGGPAGAFGGALSGGFM